MNSKQLNFFIVPEDLPEINEFLKKEGCQIVQRQTENLNDLSNYDIALNHEKIAQVYLYRKDFAVNLKYKYLEAKDCYYIDIVRSYAIEFTLGGFYPYSTTELNQSRLYFVFKFYDANELFEKNKEFVTWATNLIKLFKADFLHKSIHYPKIFFTKRCLKWIDQKKGQISFGNDKLIIG